MARKNHSDLFKQEEDLEEEVEWEEKYGKIQGLGRDNKDKIRKPKQEDWEKEE